MKKILNSVLCIILTVLFLITSSGFTSVKVKSIKLDNSKITVKVGQSLTLKVTFTPANATNKTLTLSTSNKNVATVDKSGKITAVKEGNAIITVTSSANKKAVAKCEITVTPNTPVTIKIFGTFSTVPVEKNPVIETLEKATNTKIVLIANPDNNYTERLQVMLAGGNYPDVIQFEKHTDKIFLDAVNNGVIIPVNEYLNGAPELSKSVRSISWDAMKVKGDGNIYGIPQATVMRSDGFIVRKDWLKTLHMSIPSNNMIRLDDFTMMMMRFATDDPDKNGKHDTYGIVADSNGVLKPFEFLTGAFGLLGWQEYNGKYMDLQYSKDHDNFKRALSYMNMLWKKGYIDPSWPTNKSWASEGVVAQGKVGVYGSFPGYIFDYEDMAKKNVPTAEFTYVSAVKNEKGEYKSAGYGIGYFRLFALTSAAKGKEQDIINYYNYVVTHYDIIKYGVEGVHYDVKDGKKVMKQPAYNEFRLWRTNFKMVLPYNEVGYFINPSLPFEKQELCRVWLGQAVDKLVLSKDRGYIPPANDKPEFLDYKKTMEQAMSKIIIGEMPVSEWDKVLDGWYKAGGEEYVQQMNEYIRKMEKK